MAKSTSKLVLSKKIKIILGILVLILVGAYTLEATNITHIFDDTPKTGNQYTKGETASSKTNVHTSTQQDINNTSQKGTSTDSTSSQKNINLQIPYGEFVSNHHPNLGGSPAPNKISSVCNTSHGATCTITFKKDGQIKKLPSQVTDSGGSTYWNNWSIQSIGLTKGNWEVETIAILNGNKQSAIDPLKLEVSE